jgi:integrase/recombinase XerC
MMLDRFLDYLATVKRFSPLTLRNYKRDVVNFLAWLDTEGRDSDPAKIQSDDIRTWIVHRTETGQLSAASMNRELSSLRSFFRHLQRIGEIEKNPFLPIRALKTPKRLPAFVPTTRMEGILDNIRAKNDRDTLIVLLFYSCGLRLSELVSIDRNHFSGDFTSLKVHGKGDKERIVPILLPVQKKIIAYLRQNICNSREKALFLTEQGRRISQSTVYRIVNASLRAGGVQGKTSPHVLRHTFATELLNNGADMREIQELLGHASLQATQVYTHNNIAKLREVYSKAHPREKKNY